MSETDLNKIPFLKLLNLEAITPENDSSTTFRNHLLFLPHHNADLAYKNNSIKTGYENFCIKKGTLKLFPLKDFDFIGKHVVCQRCYQKFASKLSYKAHVGTDICVRTNNEPNLIYLKYKNKKHRKVWKKSIRKSNEDFGHDIKKNVLNPELLNTLQTRNKVYSDEILQQNKVKKKPMNYSDNNNDGSFVRKLRGRPKKNIVDNNVETNLKKRGRPKKLNTMTVYNSSQNDNCSNNDLEIDESEEPKNLNDCSLSEEVLFNDTNEDCKLQLVPFKMKYISEKFWGIFKEECESIDPMEQQIQYNEEKRGFLSTGKKEIVLKLGELENDIKMLFNLFQYMRKYQYNYELVIMMSRISEELDRFKQCKPKKTDIQVSIPHKDRENVQRLFKNNENETEIKMNDIDFDKNEKSIGICINNNNTVYPKITKKMDDGCKSINPINEDNFEKESISQISSEKNLKTADKTPNITYSVETHSNDFGSNCIYNTRLNCRKHGKTFSSIAEWKLHCNEYLDKLDKTFLCTVCGLKFKMYRNYKKHVNAHKINKKTEKKCLKSLVCKVCNKQFGYLVSYYAHIKTHVIRE